MQTITIFINLHIPGVPVFLRINSPNVVREFFDGEVVIVNLENGTYYSLENAASTIWLLFEQALSVEQVLKLLSDKYEVAAERMRPMLDQFINSLLAENLVVTERLEAQQQTPNVVAHQAAVNLLSSAAATFAEPTLRKYNDMQDLLLLDPIHDVDSSGWPAAKQDSER